MRTELIGILAVMGLAWGCRHSPKDGESIDDVCQVSNDGKTVTVSGYVRQYGGTSFCTHDGCPFNIAPRAGKVPDGQQTLSAYFREGKGPRSVEVLKSSNPAPEDLVLRDDGERTFHPVSVVRVTGKARVKETDGGLVCHVIGLEHVELVED